MAEMAYLQVSRLCNQKCTFCSNPDNGKVLSWGEATALVDGFAAKKHDGLILTGGEPTVFKELPALIEYSLSKGLTPRLITNGQKTADKKYLRSLYDAGLRLMHVSVHSSSAATQAKLSRNPKSLANIIKTLDHAGALGLEVDINTTITKVNAPELGTLVVWLVSRWPYLRHFVWNNLDPLMNGADLGPDLVPTLRDLEVGLHRAMDYLASTGRTFRVARVPLCFMSDYPECSTETRRIVKKEGRSIYFLDEKGLQEQRGMHWSYGKSPRCKECTLTDVCAGLYMAGKHYSMEELCPSALPSAEVRSRIEKDNG